MLKISKMMGNRMGTRVSASFGVVSKDSHSKDTEVKYASIAEYPIQEVYGR